MLGYKLYNRALVYRVQSILDDRPYHFPVYTVCLFYDIYSPVRVSCVLFIYFCCSHVIYVYDATLFYAVDVRVMLCGLTTLRIATQQAVSLRCCGNNSGLWAHTCYGG